MTYGICHLSIIPLKVAPSHNSEMGSQLLFGDRFEVIKASDDKEWLFIKNAFDGYEGWIDNKQYFPISKEYFFELENYIPPLVASPVNLLKGENKVLHLIMGASLPFYKDESVILGNEIFKYEGDVIFPVKKNDFPFLQKIALNYLNVPYLWGGKSNFGIDCSGFVQQVFHFCGYQLPRDAYQQAEKGESITFDELKPGDVAFFNNEQGKVIHVGIVLENGLIIHASGHVKIEKLDEKGIYNSVKKDYSHKLHSLKRFFS